MSTDIDDLREVAPWLDPATSVDWLPPTPVSFSNKRDLHVLTHAKADDEPSTWQVRHELDIPERSLPYAHTYLRFVRKARNRPEFVLDSLPCNHPPVACYASPQLLGPPSSWNDRHIVASLVFTLRQVPYARAFVTKAQSHQPFRRLFIINLVPKIKYDLMEGLPGVPKILGGLRLAGVHRMSKVIVEAKIRVSVPSADKCICQTHTHAHCVHQPHEVSPVEHYGRMRPPMQSQDLT